MDNRFNSIERVLDERAARGATDASLIGWLESLKGTHKGKQAQYFNKIMDSFIDAIKQTPLIGE